jgi:NAD(P)-dependent dehydrogenase (short-subunit alcohol dehydrogenase family)
VPRGLFDLSGKAALVTGATRGIGRSIAEELGRAGARVVVSSESHAECAQSAIQLQNEDIDAHGIGCDLAVEGQVDALVRGAHEAMGQIDVLVCNAGVAPHWGPIATSSAQDWDLTMTVNLRSVLRLTALVIPGMASRRDGAVVLMSSIAGLRGNRSIGLYAVSKAAVAQLARNLAVEWGPSNVRVNAISPGVIDTEFAKPLLDDPAAITRRIALTPLRRVGEPREVAGIVVMLASAAGAFVTGQNIVVDGGTLVGDGS